MCQNNIHAKGALIGGITPVIELSDPEHSDLNSTLSHSFGAIQQGNPSPVA
jgi:hypothetical protein